MSVSSLEFIAFALLLCATYFLIPGRAARRLVLATCNAGVLWFACAVGGASPSPWPFAALAAFLLSGYAVGLLLIRRPSRPLLASYLTLLVAAFVYLKRYSFLYAFLPASLLSHPISIIGLSYMLFRQIHFLVDAAQGQIERPSLWTYLNYQLNFTTLLAGPIQRYQDFARDWSPRQPVLLTRVDLLAAYQRIFVGVIKVAALGALCMSLYKTAYGNLLRGADPASSWALTRPFALRNFLQMFYAYPAFVFFDFSGYCDIVIGVASLLGIRLPENFDRPYVSRNMIDFWTRQHMSLSFWIRDYLFTPLYKAAVERRPDQASAAAFAAYFFAFLLAGIWHGSTFNWIVFGLLHGAGVSAVKGWEMIIVRRSGRPGLKRYLAVPWVRVAAVVVTLNFVCFTFIFFTPDLAQKVGVLRAVFKAVV